QLAYFRRVCGMHSNECARCVQTSSRIAAINAAGGAGGTCSLATTGRQCIPRTSEQVAHRRLCRRPTSTNSTYLLPGPEKAKRAPSARARGPARVVSHTNHQPDDRVV